MKAVVSKRRSQQHLTDDEGGRLLASCLPSHWVLRPYRPDYGLDYSLEIFREAKGEKRKTFETLGEHVFIQLKSTKCAKARAQRIFSRYNVEKRGEALDRTDLVGTLQVVPISIDSAKLTTVFRMGVGVPVLLVIADLTSQCCYFVCLNDYIDKILIPRFGVDATSRSRSIDVPTENRLVIGGMNDRVLRWYGKRAKLYAAFQRFVFQSNNLQHEYDAAAAIEMARYFAARLVGYDFWDDTEIWSVVGHYGKALRHFLASDDAISIRLEPGIPEYELMRNGDGAEVKAADVRRLWALLALLPENYEDICREWFLPTAMGFLTGYAYSRKEDSVMAKCSLPAL